MTRPGENIAQRVARRVVVGMLMAAGACAVSGGYQYYYAQADHISRAEAADHIDKRNMAGVGVGSALVVAGAIEVTRRKQRASWNGLYGSN